MLHQAPLCRRGGWAFLGQNCAINGGDAAPSDPVSASSARHSASRPRTVRRPRPDPTFSVTTVRSLSALPSWCWRRAGQELVDFGLRRAHGAEAGVLAARAGYLAGFDATARCRPVGNSASRWAAPSRTTLCGASGSIRTYQNTTQSHRHFGFCCRFFLALRQFGHGRLGQE